MLDRIRKFRISIIQRPFKKFPTDDEVFALKSAFEREANCEIDSIEMSKTPDNFISFFTKKDCNIYAGLASVCELGNGINPKICFQIEPLKIANMFGILHPDCDRTQAVTQEKCRAMNFYRKIDKAGECHIRFDSFSEEKCSVFEQKM